MEVVPIGLRGYGTKYTHVQVDDVVATVDVSTNKVECAKDEGLAARLAKAVQRVEAAWRPIAVDGAL